MHHRLHPARVIRAATRLALLPVLSGMLAAQAAPVPITTGGAAARRLDDGIVYFDDTRSDGVLWARGDTYKASFDPHGATYIPFLGSDAPRNYPVSFRLQSIRAGNQDIAFEASAAVTRTGDVIDLDRGSVIERYRLDPQSMEQQFVFASLPRGGDVVVRIALESDLLPREEQGRIELANELGAVRYGRATVLDARGEGAPAPTVLVDGGIEIRVPAAFLERARFPLVIDPLVTTFQVAVTTADDFDADVAYEAFSDTYLVVFEEAFSAADHDARARLVHSSGAILQAMLLDVGAQNMIAPRVATNATARQFLAVMNRDHAEVMARTIGTSPFSLGSQFVPVPAVSAILVENVDVGGDAVDGGNYCLVWQKVSTITSASTIHVRRIASSGFLGFVTQLSPSGETDSHPSISNSNGRTPSAAATRTWNVVWQHDASATQHPLRFAQVDGSVTPVTPATDVPTGSNEDRACVSPPLDNGRWLVVSQKSVTGGGDLIGRIYDGSTLLSTTNISLMEDQAGAQNIFEDQVLPSVDSDGVNFFVACSESFNASTTNYDVFVSTFRTSNGELVLSDLHADAANASTREDRPRIACNKSGGGGAQRAMVVWDDDAVGVQQSDIRGALWDASPFTKFCLPGHDAVACPCGNQPVLATRGCNNSSHTGGASFVATGSASLTNDTVAFTSSATQPSASCLFFQGQTQVNATFGMGIRCVSGSVKRLYSKNAVSGVVHAPTGTELSVSARSAQMGDVITPGSTRFYQVLYRDVTVIGGCPASATFNTSAGLMVLWTP